MKKLMKRLCRRAKIALSYQKITLFCSPTQLFDVPLDTPLPGISIFSTQEQLYADCFRKRIQAFSCIKVYLRRPGLDLQVKKIIVCG